MDWEDPNKSTRTSARNLDRDPIRELHQGQRPYAPHQRAGHMTAPDQVAKTSLKPLAGGGRPHMIFAPPASGRFCSPGMSAVCAEATSRIDVKPPSQIATANGASGRASGRRAARPPGSLGAIAPFNYLDARHCDGVRPTHFLNALVKELTSEKPRSQETSPTCFPFRSRLCARSIFSCSARSVNVPQLISSGG